MEQLTKLKLEQLNKQPIIESSVGLSEDKKWVIHKTVITDIKPVTYIEKVLTGKKKEEWMGKKEVILILLHKGK